ncbi:N-formylglutamate amidohydrolase [Henriciella litoralis]|uniref:N-formylglutamate amidohydrolase n=1 Tax=Henriciella litoralis TaxID=568102 RepID=UPI0009FCF308
MSLIDTDIQAAAPADLPMPAFRLLKPQGEHKSVIFASPHSGAFYPDSLMGNLRVPLIDLRRTEDAYIDRLFENAPLFGASLLAANYARSYVDLNRDAREIDPDMFEHEAPGPVGAISPRVQAGLGCFPRIGARGEPIYAKKLSFADGHHRLTYVHTPYHEALSNEIAALHQDFGSVILIDCHSMPSSQPGRSTMPDFVLGDRFGSSCTGQLTNLVERQLRSLGCTVARNAPYAGGYTTRRYGRPKRHVHTLQIEINRKLYMDETTVEPDEGLHELRTVLDQLMEQICAFGVRLRP